MTTIKFDRSVKYDGVRYAAHEVFSVADEDVEDLTKAGATILNREPALPPCATEVKAEDKGEDVVQLREELLEYSVRELTEFAKERGISLDGKTRKADIYNIIVAHLN